MTERRARTRGKEYRGQSSRSTDAMAQEVERKRKEAEARLTATGKLKHEGTQTPSWTRRDMEIEVGNQKPDGLNWTRRRG
jgi:hypothetical protein